jgi:Acyl-CoA reductase (LuxC)
LQRSDGIDPRVGDSRHPSDSLALLLAENRLLESDAERVVRLPMLCRGKLIIPPDIDPDVLRKAVEETGYGEVGDAQVLRQGMLDPQTLRPSGRDLLFVLPRVGDVRQVLVQDHSAMAHDLNDLPVGAALELIDRVRGILEPGGALFERASRLASATSGTPPGFLRAALTQGGRGLDGTSLRAQLDFELRHGHLRAEELLDGWCSLEGGQQGPASLFAQQLGEPVSVYPRARFIRALPTRQLHVTAGNSPTVPLLSCFWALALKSPLTLKAASGALPIASALAIALSLASQGHPLVDYASIMYWRGGDARVETLLFGSESFDRIVVWGDRESIASVHAQASLTKTISFNPRYGASLIGRDALKSDFNGAARAVVRDAMVWNQKGCNASLVAYVEGSQNDARRFAQAVSMAMAEWDDHWPNPLTAEDLARIRIARRGTLRAGEWSVNGEPRAPSSAALYMPAPFDLASHPMTRIVVVRELGHATEVFEHVTRATSQIGVAPEALRIRLRNELCARGVSAVVPLGEADSAVLGMPHDSMRPLSELVAWAVS